MLKATQYKRGDDHVGSYVTVVLSYEYSKSRKMYNTSKFFGWVIVNFVISFSDGF